MKAIAADGFENMFQADTDPWNYAGSRFEAFKRRELVRACGERLYGRGLEIACANGETSRALAPRCIRLRAVDSSPTVIAAARERVRDRRIRFEVAILPAETPRGPFDLIVASEILYYLPLREMKLLLLSMRASLAPGGRVVLVHHTVGFPDASQPPKLAQAAAVALLSRSLRPVIDRQYRRFNVAALDQSA